MEFDPSQLDQLSREELILHARARGVERPELMTRIELRDEIVRRSEPDVERARRSRGWLGVARDLLASVVESGLNMHDAAAVIRGDGRDLELHGPPPVATVTLAEIYAAQGHLHQALGMLDEVIAREPDHQPARELRERLVREREQGPGNARRRRAAEAAAARAAVEEPAAPVPVSPAVAEFAVAETAGADPATSSAEPYVASAEPYVASAEPYVAAAEPYVAAAEPLVPAGESFEAGPAPEATPAVEAPAPQNEVPAGAAASEPSPETARAPESALPPAAYGEPAVVLVRRRDRAFVFWQVPALDPALRLRSVSVRAGDTDPTVEERDYELFATRGGFWLPRLAPGDEARAALGRLTENGFAPLFVAPVLGDLGYEAAGHSGTPSALAEAALLAAGAV